MVNSDIRIVCLFLLLFFKFLYVWLLVGEVLYMIRILMFSVRVSDSFA